MDEQTNKRTDEWINELPQVKLKDLLGETGRSGNLNDTQ